MNDLPARGVLSRLPFAPSLLVVLQTMDCPPAPDAAALFTKAVGDIARARGMMQLARGTGITREGLYKALGEQGNPSFATVVKVLHALGLQFNVGTRLVQRRGRQVRSRQVRFRGGQPGFDLLFRPVQPTIEREAAILVGAGRYPDRQHFV